MAVTPPWGEKSMATFIFTTHTQAACLATTKDVCAPMSSTTGCGCLFALDKAVEKSAGQSGVHGRWKHAQNLRMKAKYLIYAGGAVVQALQCARLALDIVVALGSVPEIDVKVFEADYAMALYLHGGAEHKAQAVDLWTLILEYAAEHMPKGSPKSAEDLLYKHTLCDQVICKMRETTDPRLRRELCSRGLSIARDIGHAHMHLLAVELDLM